MSEITVRRATLDDVDALLQMENECFTDPWDKRTFEGLLANPAVYFIIAENNSEPVAYGGMTVIIDESEILNVAVRPEMRQKGLGRLMVNEMLDICRKCDVVTVFLEHRQSNFAAASLYESIGFVVYGVRKRYYSSPTEDAVLRNLNLSRKEI